MISGNTTNTLPVTVNLEAMERRQVLSVLQRLKYNKVKAANSLGISCRSLYRLIEKYRREPTTS
jgi:transcriptional regulator with PAS, ATPase and Fis domain